MPAFPPEQHRKSLNGSPYAGPTCGCHCPQCRAKWDAATARAVHFADVMKKVEQHEYDAGRPFSKLRKALTEDHRAESPWQT